MEAALAAKEGEKVAAQRELHELQLHCRSGTAPGGSSSAAAAGRALRAQLRRRSGGDPPGGADADGEGVAGIIEDLEAQRIGGQPPVPDPRRFSSSSLKP
jgi:hypothetical protein